MKGQITKYVANSLFRQAYCHKPIGVFLAFCLFLPFSTHAEIYKWVDSQGKTHFTDQKPEATKTETVQVNVNRANAIKIAPKSPSNRIVSAGKKVVMYSTASCGYCKKARRFFRKNNIVFKEYDVNTTRKGKRDYARLKGRGVPIILVGKARINGFNRQRFLQVYGT